MTTVTLGDHRAQTATATPRVPPIVTLTPLQVAHAPLAWHWFNDPQVLRTAGIGMTPRTLAATQAWIERRAADPGGAWFAVNLLPEDEVVGMVGLRDIDRQQGSAELAIMIGAAAARGRGVGTEATRQMLQGAFAGFGLRRVILEAVAGNLGGLHAYARAGFREVGRLREADLTLTTPQDTVQMEARIETWADVSGSWRPLLPPEVAAELADYAGQWWIAGGWAVDLAVGQQTRRHADIDVEVLRREQAALGAYLSERGWLLFAADPPGTLRRWWPEQEPELPADVHDIWCRPAVSAPWAIQLMLVNTARDADGREWWLYRRDARIRRPLATYGWRTPDGLPVIPPEVQLLYKARTATMRQRDEADATVLLPRLDVSGRDWLRRVLGQLDPQHAWLQRPELRGGNDDEGYEAPAHTR